MEFCKTNIVYFLIILVCFGCTKTKKANKILEKQIATLCCVLNPEAIGICSDVLKEIKIHLSTIPLSHQPKLINITDLYEMIEEGLFQIGKKKIGENENE